MIFNIFGGVFHTRIKNKCDFYFWTTLDKSVNHIIKKVWPNAEIIIVFTYSPQLSDFKGYKLSSR